jgi:hypothetical protein
LRSLLSFLIRQGSWWRRQSTLLITSTTRRSAFRFGLVSRWRLGCFCFPTGRFVAAIGLSLGGGLGNLLDHYLWPGGTPDFISVSWLFPDAIWNPADLLIVIGTIGVGLALLVWPVHVGLRQWRQSASALS